MEFDLISGEVRDLISTNEFGYKHGIGLEIKDDLLFALSSETTAGKSSSLLLVYDLNKDRFLKSFRLQDTVSHFMNDLAISDTYQVYITDTERHMVYKLDYPDGEIAPYIQEASIQHPNGIAISDELGYLFVDSWSEGMRIVDLADEKVINPKYSDTDKMVAVDGLKYHDGHLYGISNGSRDKDKHAFVKIKLAQYKKDIDTVINLVLAHPQMDIPTTFCIDEGHAYILANSQLDKLDQTNNKIINADSLAETYIIRFKF